MKAIFSAWMKRLQCGHDDLLLVGFDNESPTMRLEPYKREWRCANCGHVLVKNWQWTPTGEPFTQWLRQRCGKPKGSAEGCCGCGV